MDIAAVKNLMTRFTVGESTDSRFIKYVGWRIICMWREDPKPQHGVQYTSKVEVNEMGWDSEALAVIEAITDTEIVVRAPVKVYGSDFRVHFDTVSITIPFALIVMLLSEMGREDIDDVAPDSYLVPPQPTNIIDVLGALVPASVLENINHKAALTYQLRPIDERRSEVVLSFHKMDKDTANIYKNRKLWSDWADFSYLNTFTSYYAADEK